jgi:hypothetical protein
MNQILKQKILPWGDKKKDWNESEKRKKAREIKVSNGYFSPKK